MTQPDMMPNKVVFDQEDVLEQLGHDGQLLREIIDIFLRDLPASLATIRQAMTAGNMVTVAKTAHMLKGTLGSLGAQAAMTAALRLEKVGTSGVIDHIDTAYFLLESELARLTPVLAAFSPQHLATTHREPDAKS